MANSLIDRDATRAREREYPNTAGNALKQVAQAGLEAHFSSMEKYVDWVQELLKRKDVTWSVKLAILGGADPLVFGGEIPAVMMAKLEPIGIDTFEISGGMVVSESNKASTLDKTGVESVTGAGVGTALWHVNEQLTVKHSHDEKQTRRTDYRSRFNWKMVMKPMGEPEGVELIKEATSQAFAGVMRINEKIVAAQEKIALAKLHALPNQTDADKAMKATDMKDDDDDPDDGGEPDDNGNGDDEDTGTGTQTDDDSDDS